MEALVSVLNKAPIEEPIMEHTIGTLHNVMLSGTFKNLNGSLIIPYKIMIQMYSIQFPFFLTIAFS